MVIKLRRTSALVHWNADEHTRFQLDICSGSNLASFISASLKDQPTVHLADISYGTGKDHNKHSGLFLACLHSVACKDGQPTGKAAQALSEMFIKDQF